MVRMSTTSQTATNEQAKNEKEMRNNCWKNWAAPKRSELSNFKVDSNWSGRQWSSWDWCQETQYAVWTFGRCAQRMPLHLQRFIAGRYKQNSLQNDPSPSSKHRPTTKASQWCNLMSLSQWDQVTNTATQQHTQTDTHTHTGKQAGHCTQRQDRIHASAGNIGDCSSIVRQQQQQAEASDDGRRVARCTAGCLCGL